MEAGAKVVVAGEVVTQKAAQLVSGQQETNGWRPELVGLVLAMGMQNSFVCPVTLYTGAVLRSIVGGLPPYKSGTMAAAWPGNTAAAGADGRACWGGAG